MLPLLLSKQRRSFLLEVDSSEEATIGKICSELSSEIIVSKMLFRNNEIN
ncbi:hypothetical protein V1478_016633 [Vespula squamosa]|uniref:Uncharacterized protein n=1 Tax=Vespula squamosa TaxID=30214 RepID=A0ABD2A0B7_VESSQ